MRVVTVSADVAITTHLAGWMNRKGIYFPEARPDPFADTPQALRWREGPRGQHVEIGIAEHDLFLLLAALGLTAELSGETLLPIGTLYDPFITRGLDALYHALYCGARFIVVATPSGRVAVARGRRPPVRHHAGHRRRPAGPRVLRAGVRARGGVDPARRAARGGRAARESRTCVSAPRRSISGWRRRPTTRTARRCCAGGYRLIDGRARRPGGMPRRPCTSSPPARWCRRPSPRPSALREQGAFPSLFVVTSPDHLYRGLREPRPYLETLVSADEEDVPVVSVLDGHSHALAFLGARSACRSSRSAWTRSGSPGRGGICIGTTGSTPTRSSRAARTFLG